MFSTRPVGSASEADPDRRQVEGSRRQSRHERAGTREFAVDVGSFLARVVGLVLSVVVLIIVAGILLVVLKANPANSIVSEVHSWAHWLASPFDGMFNFHSANTAIAVNWGIAAVVYLLVGGLIVRLLGSTYRDRPARRSSYSNEEIA
jgi:uncharacterized protein involved in cysteine biosynthesis